MYFVIAAADPPHGSLATLDYDFSDDPDPLRDWMAGERFEEEPPTPVRATVEPTANAVPGDLWQVPLPIMSRRLHEVLLGAGVDNLEVFAAHLVNSNGDVDDGFVAFNIVGLVAATTIRTTSSIDLLDGFTVDAAKAGPLMFRLEEACNTIVVHHSVRQAIEHAGISTVRFFDTTE
jgi:hypothetical protein